MVFRLYRVAASLGCMLVATGPGLTAAQAAPKAGAPDCNRRCLLEFLQTYTEGLLDNDTSRIKVALGLRVTSNGVDVRLGKGEIWGLAKRMPYRQALVDPVTGAAILMGTATNAPTDQGERWWFYMVRLKVVAKQVAEVEEISYDGTLRRTPASKLAQADRIYDAVLPPDERVSRAELIATANKYFDVVSGTLDYHDAPWHPECSRLEDALLTVNEPESAGSCAGEFKNPRIKWIVKNRRFYIADVERGIVMAVANFTSPPEYPNNNASVVFEVFKIQDGLIRHIEAMFRGDSSMKTSTWPDVPSEAPARGADRAVK
ncbi:MAG TPA: hypothetical protein VMD03_01420 [Steroidobacteraceae bacterium]|nr:hypothetical protein [Steroidobacteraceae bacterium]